MLQTVDSGIYAQDNSVITGKIINGEDKEPLPFASIRLKNHPIGTISNEEGEFDFYIPKSKRNDSSEPENDRYGDQDQDKDAPAHLPSILLVDLLCILQICLRFL